MKQRTLPWIILLWCVVLGLAWIPWGARAEVRRPLFQHRNGYLISGPFLEFFEQNGGAARFGEPRTDQFIEPGGLTVQYFDYVRFEWHDQVVLTHLGRQAAADHPDHAAFAWLAPDAPAGAGRTYFPESGHTLGGAFGWFWQTHGQLVALGYPISEEFTAPGPDGTPRLTQYFERAVLTYHPDQAGAGDEVRREPLGARFAPPRPTTPAPAVLAEARLAVVPGTGDERNIAVASERLHGHTLAPGARLSFLAVAGPITAARGYGPGSAIVGGAVVHDAIGGGICAVSTLLYRVAWHAGLPVEERRGHSVWLQTFADLPGLEAAVEDSSRDLVIRNDTAGPLFVEAQVAGGYATLRLWGAPDGRAVAVERPLISSGAPAAAAPGAAAPALRPAETGATVINTRRITLLGKAPRVERVLTVYAPLPTPAATPTPAAETSTSR